MDKGFPKRDVPELGTVRYVYIYYSGKYNLVVTLTLLVDLALILYTSLSTLIDYVENKDTVLLRENNFYAGVYEIIHLYIYIKRLTARSYFQGVSIAKYSDLEDPPGTCRD
jgi:hypothetical protein